MAAHIKHFIFNGDLSIKEMTDVSVMDGTEIQMFSLVYSIINIEALCHLSRVSFVGYTFPLGPI